MAAHRLLALEAAESCRERLTQWTAQALERDIAVEYALTLCGQVERQILHWPATRLHRALGFIQGVLVARELSTWDEQHELMEQLQVSFPESRDPDLADHLDPGHHFRLELGGSG